MDEFEDVDAKDYSYDEKENDESTYWIYFKFICGLFSHQKVYIVTNILFSVDTHFLFNLHFPHSIKTVTVCTQ